MSIPALPTTRQETKKVLKSDLASKVKHEKAGEEVKAKSEEGRPISDGERGFVSLYIFVTILISVILQYTVLMSFSCR